MQKNIYLIAILFSLMSCYTYQVKKPAELPLQNNQQEKKNIGVSNVASVQMPVTTAEMQSQKTQPAFSNAASVPVNIHEKLQPTKNYRIKVDGRAYKVIVDKWESDSLVAHPVKRPKEILKFHKNQIDAESIAEKRFSQPVADVITVLAYAGIGVGIWALLQ